MGDTPGKINMSPKKSVFFWKEMHLPWFFQGIPVKFPNCTCIDYLKNVQKSRNLVTESYDVNGSSWVALSIFNIFSYIMSKFMYSIEEIYHLLYWYVQISSKHIPSSTSKPRCLNPFCYYFGYIFNIANLPKIHHPIRPSVSALKLQGP